MPIIAYSKAIIRDLAHCGISDYRITEVAPVGQTANVTNATSKTARIVPATGGHSQHCSLFIRRCLVDNSLVMLTFLILVSYLTNLPALHTNRTPEHENTRKSITFAGEIGAVLTIKDIGA